MQTLLRSAAFALPLGLLAACASTTLPPNPAAVGSAQAVAAPAPQSVRFAEGGLDDAMGRAKRSGKLLFVDGWAPWCHTCLSMRQTVLEQPELARYSDRFEFVAIDTDRPEAAGFVERYPMRVWPTFFVIEPASGAVLASYGGSLSQGELFALLDRALAARARPDDLGLKALADAHRAYQERRLVDAARMYEDAATKLGDDSRAEPLVAAIRALWQAEKREDCVAMGERHLGSIRGSSAPVDFAYYLKECASSLPEGDPRRAATLGLVRARLSAIAAAPPVGMSVDDRADLLGGLAELARDARDDASARVLEEQRLALLEDAAERAATVVDAQVYDYARMNAYLALGRGDEAVALFRRRIKELPDNYEPHARLGSTLVELKRFKEAAPALERAVALSYGPRRLRYLALLAKAQLAAGDSSQGVATLEQEVRGWKELPGAQRDEKKLADAEQRLGAAKASK